MKDSLDLVNDFAGCVALATPFNKDESLDIEGFDHLLTHLMDAGLRGFVIGGSTGEGLNLSRDEQLQLLKLSQSALERFEKTHCTCEGIDPIKVATMSDQAANAREVGSAAQVRPLPPRSRLNRFQHRPPQLWAAIFQTRTQDALEHLHALKEISALKALLIPIPYYIKPSPRDITAYFEQLKAATDLPLVLYNNPTRAGVSASIDTLQALYSEGLICGLKESSLADERIRPLIQLHHAQCLKSNGQSYPRTLFCGNDDRLDTLADVTSKIDGAAANPTHIDAMASTQRSCSVKAQGKNVHLSFISASANVLPHTFALIDHYLRRRQWRELEKIHRRAQPLLDKLTSHPNPAIIKAILAEQGLCSAYMRAPLHPSDRDLARALANEIRDLERASRSAVVDTSSSAI